MRRRLLAVTTIAMLAVAALPGITSAVSQAWEGKGEGLIYHATGLACGGPTGTDTGPFGTVKIDVKDGFIKVGIKFEAFTLGANQSFHVYLHQDVSNGSCSPVKQADLGEVTFDGSGKGGLKAVVPYVCPANWIWVLIPPEVGLASLAVSLENPVGSCV